MTMPADDVAPGLSVLVAEDDPHIRRVLEVTLRRQGFAVTAVADGVEALEMLQSRVFDVVLADGMMPRLGGLDVCRRLKADPRLAAIPVIVLSARTSLTDEAAVREAGAAGFLRKPFDIVVLREAIRRVVGATG